MDLITIVVFALPIALLVAFFVGLVKNNKRLWIVSLIFFVVVIAAECAFLMPVYKKGSSTLQETSAVK